MRTVMVQRPARSERPRFRQAQIVLRLELGQSHEVVADVPENVPESATSIDVTVRFE